MIRFDPTLGHSLICMQANTGVPEDHRECVCQVSVIEHASQTSRRTYAALKPEPMFEPTYEIDGPYEGGPYAVADRIRTWAQRIGLLVLVSFAVGYVLRHYGFL